MTEVAEQIPSTEVSVTKETVDPKTLMLRTPWALHFSCQTKTSSWETKRIYAFDNVADFMNLGNHTKLPSNFAGTIELSMFREGVVPAWEYEPAKSGGRWNVRIEKFHDSQIDLAWSEMLLAMVGDTMMHGLPESIQSHVLGIAYSGKPQAARKLSLWTSCRDAEQCNIIGNRFKDTLQAILPMKELGEFLFNDFTTNDKYAFVIGTKQSRGKGSSKRN